MKRARDDAGCTVTDRSWPGLGADPFGTIAIVLAQELSRVLKKPLAVESAEFVDSKEAQLYEFSSLNSPARSFGLATAFAPMSIVDSNR